MHHGTVMGRQNAYTQLEGESRTIHLASLLGPTLRVTTSRAPSLPQVNQSQSVTDLRQYYSEAYPSGEAQLLVCAR